MSGINGIDFNPDKKIQLQEMTGTEKTSLGSIIKSDKSIEEAKTMGTGIEMSNFGPHERLSKQLRNIFIVKGVLHQNGGTALEPMAEKLCSKGQALVRNSIAAIDGLNEELKALQNNKELSPSEIESKTKLIQAKIEAVEKEAGAKIGILDTLASALPSLIGMVKEMQENGIPLDTLTEIFDKITENMSSAPSNLKGAENSDDLNKLLQNNMKNLLGSDSTEKTEALTKDLDKKTEVAQDKLKNPDLSKEEKDKAKIELKIFRKQKNIIQDLSSKLQSAIG